MKRPHAFPVTADTLADDQGMTLRDWFAGQAMAAYINGPWHPDMGWGPKDQTDPGAAARFGYEVADEMLKERSL